MILGAPWSVNIAQIHRHLAFRRLSKYALTLARRTLERASRQENPITENLRTPGERVQDKGVTHKEGRRTSHPQWLTTALTRDKNVKGLIAQPWKTKGVRLRSILQHGLVLMISWKKIIMKPSQCENRQNMFVLPLY